MMDKVKEYKGHSYRYTTNKGQFDGGSRFGDVSPKHGFIHINPIKDGGYGEEWGSSDKSGYGNGSNTTNYRGSYFGSCHVDCVGGDG